MAISPISSGHSQLAILSDIARINPQLAAANLAKTAKDMVALELIDGFLDAQRARIMAGAYSTYSTNGAAGSLDRSFYYGLAASLIALA